mmetsp:Transcript_69749/g.151761  ORF Transcript_69749/g.151761 Transcript_69749/m.151761 type:complete len:358 (-) Transcript_69749:126-1199(-)
MPPNGAGGSVARRGASRSQDEIGPTRSRDHPGSRLLGNSKNPLAELSQAERIEHLKNACSDMRPRNYSPQNEPPVFPFCSETVGGSTSSGIGKSYPPGTGAIGGLPSQQMEMISSLGGSTKGKGSDAAYAHDVQPMGNGMAIFDSCNISDCRQSVEEIGHDRDEDSYVTRTFYWRAEDFPLEVATYMQCEEPWAQREAAANNLAGRYGLRATLPRIRVSQVAKVCADDVPNDMLENDDDCPKVTSETSNAHQQQKVSPEAPLEDTFLSGARQPRMQDDGLVSLEEDGRPDQLAPAPPEPSVSKRQAPPQQLPDEEDWDADWSVLAPPVALVAPDGLPEASPQTLEASDKQPKGVFVF